MIFELSLALVIFVLALYLLHKDFHLSFIVLMILSVFLHKELFSIYRWDFLPIRAFMLAVLAYSCLRFVSWFEKLDSKKRIFVQLKNPFVVLMLLLWLVKVISIANSRNLFSSVSLLGFFTTIVALGLLLFAKFKNLEKSEILNYLKIYIYIVFVLSLFGYFQALLYYKTGVIIGALWNIPGNLPRIGATFWDVNHFGALLAVLLSVFGAMILTGKVQKKVLSGVIFLLMCGILFLTNSRSAIIIAGVSFAVFVAIYIYKKYMWKGIVILTLLGVLVCTGLAIEYSDRSSPFRAKIKDSFHYRIDSFASHMMLLQGSYQVFEEHPLIGGGYGSFFEHFEDTAIAAEYFGRDPAALNTRVPAHTVWGEALAETGILGFSVLTAFVFFLLATLFYLAIRIKDIKDALIPASMFSSLVGVFTAGIFYSYKSEFFWILIFLFFIYAIITYKDLLQAPFSFDKVAKFVFQSKAVPAIILLLISAPLIFVALGRNHLIPWDEAIYAEVARNILRKEDLFTLYWRTDTFWFEKPPLYMLLVAGLMNIFGFGSFVPRLPSAVFGLSTVFLVYAFGKKLFNKTAGYISALAIITTIGFLYYSRIGMLDVTVTFFITLSLYLYWLAKEKQLPYLWVLSGVSVGLAIMTKGIVGFLPFAVIFLYEIYSLLSKTEKLTKRKIKNFSILIGASLLTFLPWHLYMFLRYGKAFFTTYIGYHVISRAFEEIEDKGESFWWYLLVLKVSMRLWFIVLLGSFPLTLLLTQSEKIKSKLRLTSFGYGKKYVFLIIWFVFIFTFFSSAKSKLVWYIIPIYPVACLMVGFFLEKFLEFLIAKFPFLNKFSHKVLIMYVATLISLFYFFVNRALVYRSDLTGSQARLLQLKDEKFGEDAFFYADRIDLPLILYYSEGPFEVVDYGPLQDRILNALPGDEIIFITKESRYRNFAEVRPRIQLIEQDNEWVLAYLPSLKKFAETELEDVTSRITKLEAKIEELQLEQRSTLEKELQLQELKVLRDQYNYDIQVQNYAAFLEYLK